jgi:hypothetical protein
VRCLVSGTKRKIRTNAVTLRPLSAFLAAKKKKKKKKKKSGCHLRIEPKSALRRESAEHARESDG